MTKCRGVVGSRSVEARGGLFIAAGPSTVLLHQSVNLIHIQEPLRFAESDSPWLLR